MNISSIHCLSLSSIQEQQSRTCSEAWPRKGALLISVSPDQNSRPRDTFLSLRVLPGRPDSPALRLWKSPYQVPPCTACWDLSRTPRGEAGSDLLLCLQPSHSQDIHPPVSGWVGPSESLDIANFRNLRSLRINYSRESFCTSLHTSDSAYLSCPCCDSSSSIH